MHDLLVELKAAQKVVNKILTQLQRSGVQLTRELFVPVFERHPKLERVSWTQYTPYWNDGEPCKFSAHIDRVDAVINGEALEDAFTGKVYWDKRPNPNKVLVTVGEVLQDIGQEGLKAMFGDHVRVTVTPEEVVVDEYDHS